MKVCVFGAGAIGGFIAARLSQVPGVEVSVVARGAQLEAIRADGLRLHSPTGDITARVKVTDNPRELGVQDYVFLTLKSHQVVSALPQLEPIMGPETVVLPPTTGIPFWYFHGMEGFPAGPIERLDPGGVQWKAIPARQVLGVAYWLASEVTEPGVIHHDGSSTRIPIGEPDGSISPRALRLSEAMTAAGLDSPAVDNIRAWIWIKMISSLSWNPIAVLTRATLGELCADPQIVSIVRKMMGEADAIAARLGAVSPISADMRIGIAKDAGAHKMSMLQDIERGRPLEIDILTESISAMREIADLPTPTIDDIYALLQLHVAVGRRDGVIAQ